MPWSPKPSSTRPTTSRRLSPSRCGEDPAHEERHERRRASGHSSLLRRSPVIGGPDECGGEWKLRRDSRNAQAPLSRETADSGVRSGITQEAGRPRSGRRAEEERYGLDAADRELGSARAGRSGGAAALIDVGQPRLPRRLRDRRASRSARSPRDATRCCWACAALEARRPRGRPPGRPSSSPSSSVPTAGETSATWWGILASVLVLGAVAGARVRLHRGAGRAPGEPLVLLVVVLVALLLDVKRLTAPR